MLLNSHILAYARCRARPAHARHAPFVLSILSLAPSLSSPWEVPQVDHTRPQTFSARPLLCLKAVIRSGPRYQGRSVDVSWYTVFMLLIIATE